MAKLLNDGTQIAELGGGAGEFLFLLSKMLANLRKTVEWLLTAKRTLSHAYPANADTDDTRQIARAIADILLHGLQYEQNSTDAADTLRKLVDDFEWVRRSAQIRESLSTSAAVTVARQQAHASQNVVQFLHSWIARNMNSKCLCACLQALVADKELLSAYYRPVAFLRQTDYATALFICLSALELNQCSLLSQIDTRLYSHAIVARGLGPKGMHHKRASSHPNFSISPTRHTKLSLVVNYDADKSCQDDSQERPVYRSTILKVQSLPNMPIVLEEDHSVTPRPRSKTLGTAAVSQPKAIPKAFRPPSAHMRNYSSNSRNVNNSPAYTSSSIDSGDDFQPTNLVCSKGSPLSNVSGDFNSTVNSNNESEVSSNSSKTAYNIELIKCDDIKIWTDQSLELKPEESSSTTQNGLSITEKQPKSISPINSFLCNLFGNSSVQPNWPLDAKLNCAALLGVDNSNLDAGVAYPCNKTEQREATQTSGVFDAFLPIYGKKLRCRKAQNLFEFEDGISTLDYSSPTSASKTTVASEESSRKTPADAQSLTSFLQNAQLSRNNTALEKENAHFRISEAIISAIEHIKWAKLEPDKQPPTGTDWLESEQLNSDQAAASNVPSPSGVNLASALEDHMPYVELSESCLGLLSAEVVGLSLISKFNDQHLPKVFELKWLVSEEDAPQQLLPMPDNSATANPDDHVLPSVTRGTKYWAPPRQQIIFTDHPPTNRKELIQKQNNRCAGCGMRVSPQYLHSFRWCTYLGKFHCTGCHRNQISATPARILNAWDFKCYPVSVFAYRLIEQMYTYPLFYVPDLNPELYVRSRALLTVRTKRLQLKFVKDFIRTCRFATREQTYFEAIPDYLTADPDIWSMSDFVDTHNKCMQRTISELIEKCENHIFNCVLCTARGFLCEYCRKDQVIYPWQHKIFRCDRCGACFHFRCWKSMSETCCRCQRIHKRRDDVTEF